MRGIIDVKHPLLLICLAQFCLSTGMSLVEPIMPLYASSFHVSYIMVGLVMASFGMSRVFVEIPGGMLADRFGTKPVMIGGYVLSVASHLLAGFAQTVVELMATRMLIGTGSALSFTASMVYVTDIATVDKRSRYIALLQSTFNIAGIIGPTVGGVISETFGLRIIFFVSAALSLIGILLVQAMKTHEKGSPSEEGTDRSGLGFRDIVTDLRILTLSASCFLMFFLFSSIRGTIIPLYGVEELGLSSVEIGLIFSLTSAITVFGLLFVTHRLETRIGRSMLLPLSLLICSMAVFLLSVASNFITLAAFVLPLGIGMSILQPTSFTMISDHAQPAIRGLTLGFSRTIAALGIIVGSTMAGWLMDLGQQFVGFLLIGGILSLFSFFTYFVFRKLR
jgi:DHA1 family multidrug resistance protein-like MFS transporter